MSTRALVTAMAIVAVSCGSAGSAPETSTSSTGDTGTTSQPMTTTTTGAGASTTSLSVTTTSTVPEPLVQVSAGEVSGPDIVEVDLGDTVDFWVLSDVDDQLHVHGYDLFFDLEAGVPLNLTFSADIPGVFEVETHNGDTHMLSIEVQG